MKDPTEKKKAKLLKCIKCIISRILNLILDKGELINPNISKTNLI